MKRGQIWVETVIYTLIAFALIGLVLAFAKPRIQEIQDKAITEQSIELVKDIDFTIAEIVQGGSGNKRKMEVGIRKGSLEIDGINDKLIFEMESKYQYSEPGVEVSDGNLKVYTEEKGKFNLVNITRDYGTKYNITYQGKDESKSISKSSTPYSFLISNEGKDGNEKIIINFKID